MEWKNFDLLKSYETLKNLTPVDVKEAMAGEDGAKRVKEYQVPMSSGLVYNYAAKQVDDAALKAFQELADEGEYTKKYEALYNGDVINVGEKRLVLHQLCRGQLGKDVIADGVNKREFYEAQRKRVAEFADKVHDG